MVLNKQYLRYEKHGNCFASIASAQAPLQYVNINNCADRYVATACAEDVVIWDTKTGLRHTQLTGELAHVTSFAFTSKGGQSLVAIGYTDGRIQVLNYESQECKCKFVGHKSSVTSLCFSMTGLQLASGGADCDIVIWDIANECGMFRLRGHRQAITRLSFMNTREHLLVSSSKDTLVKFWDLRTQHCFKTLFGHKSEVWDFAIFRNDKRLVTGSNDLRVFKISFNERLQTDAEDEAESDTEEVDQSALFEEEEENEILKEDQAESPLLVKYMGNILRASTTRLSNISIDASERLLLCNGNDSFVECFKLRSKSEIKLHYTKKLRKLKRKLEQSLSVDVNSSPLDDQLSHVKIGVKDEFERLEPITIEGPLVRRTTVIASKAKSFRVTCLLNNNSFELYSYWAMDPRMEQQNDEGEQTSFKRVAQIEQQGHRSLINAIAISSDGHVLLSASKDSVKIWSRATHACFSTIHNVEQATCATFVPGDRFCVIGTKKGNLQILNIGSSEVVETINVCDPGDQVTSICPYPNDKGLVTASEARKVKFWDYDLIRQGLSKRLTLKFDRELPTDDGVVCVRMSSDMKLIAVSLLDCTVRVFYVDTFKFFLSLYGHKFPVNCMDIASDCSIIATGSADKNMKIWGLDFGDCHKSIFAHDDCITDLHFVPNTHYIFTCSRDQTIKQWDADTYEKILTLRGHQSEIAHLALGPDATFLLSAGRDQTLRLWKKTEEILVIEDELETEREVQFEKEMFASEENVVPGERNTETGLPSFKTAETAKATERLLEAIDLYEAELQNLEEHQTAVELAQKQGTEVPPKPKVNILFTVYKTDCPYRYMLEVLKSIKSAELEECLLCLPFNYVMKLIPILSTLLERNWEVELLCRTACFLVRLHIGQIIANHTLAQEVLRLRNVSKDKVTQLRDLAGYNLACVQHAQIRLLAEDELTVFAKAYNERKDKRKKNKNTKSVDSVAMISIR